MASNPAIALWLQSTRPVGRVAELASLGGVAMPTITTVPELISQRHALPTEQNTLTGFLAIRGNGQEPRIYERSDGPYIADAAFVIVTDERVERAVFGVVPPYGGGMHCYFDRAEVDGAVELQGSTLCLSRVSRVVIFREDKQWPVALDK
jgi:hypothetical protein